jgi:HAD superfamily hydrolase (TIGR01509 family)
MTRALKGIVLDVDGTLVDSNDQHARAWCRALTAMGFQAPFTVVRRLIGMGGDKLFPRMTGMREDTAIGRRVGKLRARIFREEYLDRIRPFEGSRRLVQQLLDGGTKIAIASSAEERERDALLEIAGVSALLPKKAKRTSAKHSKPDPDIVRSALRTLRLPKEHVLMVGDTPYDIEAAALAGIRTIALRCGGAWRDDDLVGAVAIYDGPSALVSAL